MKTVAIGVDLCVSDAKFSGIAVADSSGPVTVEGMAGRVLDGDEVGLSVGGVCRSAGGYPSVVAISELFTQVWAGVPPWLRILAVEHPHEWAGDVATNAGTRRDAIRLGVAAGRWTAMGEVWEATVLRPTSSVWRKGKSGILYPWLKNMDMVDGKMSTTKWKKGAQAFAMARWGLALGPDAADAMCIAWWAIQHQNVARDTAQMLAEAGDW